MTRVSRLAEYLLALIGLPVFALPCLALGDGTQGARTPQGDTLRVYRYPGEIVVTATRYPALLATLPYHMTLVRPRSEGLAARGGIPDLLEDAPGLLVQKTTTGGGSIYLNGLLGNYCLLLIDGIRMNNGALRTGPNQYLNTMDATAVQQIEVLLGPGSVLYGSDAVGGVVNVITVSPSFAPTRLPGAVVQGQVGGGDSRRVGSVQLTSRLGRAAALLDLSAASYGDLRGGDTTGTQRPTGYDTRGAMVKLSVPAGSDGILTGAYQYFEQLDVPRYDRIAAGKDLEHVYAPQRRDLVYLRGQYNLPGARGPMVDATLSYHEQDEGERYVGKPKAGKPEVQVRTHDRVQTYGLQLQGNWGSRGGRSLVIGTETYADLIESERWEHTRARAGGGDSLVSEKPGNFPNGTRYLTSAFFARGVSGIGHGLTLHLGSRLNLFHIDADLADRGSDFGRWTQSYYEPTGELRLMAEDGLGFLPPAYVGVGRAFRAPNAFDLTAVGLVFSSGVDVPNRDLRPERGWTYELGSRWSGPEVSWRGRAYLSDLVDLIVRRPATYQGSDSLGGQPVFDKRNAGRAQLWGWSNEVRFEPENGIWFTLSADYARGQSLTDHEPLTRIPPLSGRVAAGQNWVERHMQGAVFMDWARSQRRLSASDSKDTRIPQGGTPGFAVVGLSARWQPLGWLDLGLRLDNILDKDYRVHGSGVNGEGRSVTASLRLVGSGGVRAGE